jgi:hypothetical protein
VTDIKVHTFGEACLYRITFAAADDDGGSASDAAVVIVTGTASRSRSSGNWQHQFSRRGHTDFTDARLQCYLQIVSFASRIFNEVRNASTIPAAFDVLRLNGNGGSEKEKFDRELLTAWLNFANGSVGYNELIDLGHGRPDTPFSVIVASAEAVRANPAATDTQLRVQRQLLQHVR